MGTLERIPTNPDKHAQVDGVLDRINKTHGNGTIRRLGDPASNSPLEAIPSGALTLDLALGVGGFPRGRVVEVFGPESSGKTTLALSVASRAQRAGGYAAFVDVEHALDPQYALAVGVDMNNLLVSQPDSGEQALEIVETLARSCLIDVIVLDSVAALVPKAEIEGEMGDSHVGLQARLMSQAMRKLVSVLSRSQTCCIFINQIREKVGVLFGNPETTPGGRALKFFASVRLDVRKKDTLKQGSEAIGSHVLVKVVKNKVAPPFRNAELDIIYGRGISSEGCLLDVGVEAGVVSRTGTWYSFRDERLGQGRENARAYLEEHPPTAAEIEATLRQAQIAHLPRRAAPVEAEAIPA